MSSCEPPAVVAIVPVTTLGEPVELSTETVDGERLFVIEIGEMLIDLDRDQAVLMHRMFGALLHADDDAPLTVAS